MRRVSALLLGLLAISVSGCTEEKDKPRAEGKPAATQKAPKTPADLKTSPELCLARGGLSDVNHSSKNRWGGFDGEDMFLGVERFESTAAARTVVRQATDVDGAAVRRYAVLGQMKGTGSAEAVATVADCLRNG